MSTSWKNKVPFIFHKTSLILRDVVNAMVIANTLQYLSIVDHNVDKIALFMNNHYNGIF